MGGKDSQSVLVRTNYKSNYYDFEFGDEDKALAFEFKSNFYKNKELMKECLKECIFNAMKIYITCDTQRQFFSEVFSEHFKENTKLGQIIPINAKKNRFLIQIIFPNDFDAERFFPGIILFSPDENLLLETIESSEL